MTKLNEQEIALIHKVLESTNTQNLSTARQLINLQGKLVKIIEEIRAESNKSSKKVKGSKK